MKYHAHDSKRPAQLHEFTVCQENKIDRSRNSISVVSTSTPARNAEPKVGFRKKSICRLDVTDMSTGPIRDSKAIQAPVSASYTNFKLDIT